VVECNLAKVEVVGSNPISRSMRPSLRRGLVSFLALASATGCAHQVRVESNVPEAEVRVDGVVVGQAGSGATFTERAGPGAIYDIEVSAHGYRTARRRLSPGVADPVVGIPAMCSMISGCTFASCAVPLSLAVVSISPDDTDVQCIGYGCAAGSAAWAGGSAALAAWGGERLPDVITVDLEPIDDDVMAH
jgi:hypothetical protein